MAKKAKQKRYKVTVVRTSYARMEIEVEAENAVKAGQMACDQAGNKVFFEHDADYEVEHVKEATDEAS